MTHTEINGTDGLIKLRVPHGDHTHLVLIEDDTDEILEVDGLEIHFGYITRQKNGELTCCLPEDACS